MKKVIAAALALSAVLLAAGSAQADGVPTPFISETIQVGQGVQIDFSIPDIHMNVEMSLWRTAEGSDDRWYVFEDHDFSQDEAVGTVDYGEGFFYYQFEVIDECVLPDDYAYSLWMADFPSYITVEDTGDTCLRPGWITAQEGSSNEGCSVSGIGADATAGALGILMLGIGLAGLFVSRRRSRG